MATFIKDFIIIGPFYYSDAADSVFNGYTKCTALILIASINRSIPTTNLPKGSFTQTSSMDQNWLIGFCN